MAGMGSHHATEGKNDEWLTPPQIVHALGEFDLDPCSPIKRPFDIAKNYFTILEDGLAQDWFGRVWLNPPYNRYQLEQWMRKMVDHGNGIALIFARTETEIFHNHVWQQANSALFLKGRITFYDTDGNLATLKEGKNKGKTANSGAPSVLVAYGKDNVGALDECGIEGKHVILKGVPLVVVGVSPSWRSVIKISITRLNSRASLRSIYDMVELVAPDKVRGNKHYKEKIRQKLQESFIRIDKGVYTV